MIKANNKSYLYLLISFFFLMFASRVKANEGNQELVGSINLITGDYLEAEADISLKGPFPLELKRFFLNDLKETDSTSWRFNHPNLFNEDTLNPATRSGPFKYEFEETNKLKKISSFSKDSCFNEIRFHYENEDCLIATDTTGRIVTYHFIKGESARTSDSRLISKVVYPDGTWIKYQYRKHPNERKNLITRKEFSDGRFIETEYYDEKYNTVGEDTVYISNPARDFRIGRVKLQKGPVGTNGKTSILSRFIYEEDKTIVYDAMNQKTVYSYNSHGNITKIESFGSKKEEVNPLKRKIFNWVYDDKGNARLGSLITENESDRVVDAKIFKHDAFGNVIEEIAYGNFSGKVSLPIKLENGMPIENGIEKRIKKWRYIKSNESEPPLLVEEIDVNGISKKYFYDPTQKSLIATFLEKENEVLIRQFYKYDEEGLLIETITDDGKSESSSDLTGATERHLVKITPKKCHPSKGMPEEIQEFGFDFSKGQEVFIKKTCCRYSESSELIWQGVFNDKSELLLESYKEYDANGKLQKVKQPDGKELVYVYDDSGRLLSETTAELSEFKAEVKNHYDAAGKLILSYEVDETGDVVSTSFNYDSLGRKIESIDTYGNKTFYSYNNLGYLQEIKHPPVPNDKGELEEPKVIHQYDCLGNILLTIDPKGFETRTRYNSLNKPVEIVHPDGTREYFSYSKEGHLVSQTDKTGIKIFTERDYFGRPTRTYSETKAGVVFNEKHHFYNSFHLIKEESEEGTKEYFYDFAGRLSQEKKTLKSGEILTKDYVYNPLGKIVELLEQSSADESLFLKTCFERDLFGNVTKKTFLNRFSEVIKEEIEKKPVKNQTSKLSARNQQGQKTGKETLVDATGSIISKSFDAIGRLEEIVKRNFEGKEIEKIIYRYDLSGNKVLEEHSFLESAKKFVIQFEYGPCNRLESLKEGSYEKYRKTSYIYNSKGLLETLVKPDGVTLHYSYDDKNNLCELSSSDGTVLQSYLYDDENKLCKAEDQATSCGFLRTYNEKGELLREDFSTGLFISHQYDLARRKKKTCFFDGTSVRYDYENIFLKKVTRLGENEEEQYVHIYNERSKEGLITEETLPNGLGKQVFDYNEKGQLSKISSPFFSQEYNYESDCPTRKTKDSLGETYSSYRYDAEKRLLSHDCKEKKETYSYDLFGNLIKSDDAEFLINELNELYSDGENRYEYDLNGNLIKISNTNETKQLTYDALDRLTSITLNGTKKLSYSYDPLSRRLKTTTYIFDGSSWNKVDSKLYYYDSSQDIGFCNEKKEIKELCILGLNFNQEQTPIAIEIDGHPFLALYDEVLSLRNLVSLEDKTHTQSYRYSSFGERIVYNEDGVEDEPLTTIGFQGKRHDSESGFIFYGRRYYYPKIKRWIHLDPSGFQDGSNRYLFVKNDPIRNRDHQGLYSWGEFFSDIFTGIANLFTKLFSIGKNIAETIQTETAYLQHMQPSITNACEQFLGKGFLSLSGFYEHPPELGSFGHKEASDKVRITLLNGISNIRSYFKESLELISSAHGGTNVHYIFRPTEGWCWDMMKALLIKFGYVSPYARALANTWKELIQEMGGVESGGLIIHYCHSLGGADTATAASLLTPEEKKMVRVISFGSATRISDTLGFESATNYMSVRDGVAFFDPIGWFTGFVSQDKDVVFIGSFLGIPLIDHSFGSPTYQSVMINLGAVFMKMYAYSG